MDAQSDMMDGDTSNTEDYFDESDPELGEPSMTLQEDETHATAEVGGDVEEVEEEGGAPRYVVPPRAMGAVEVPMIVADIDRATKAFGNITTYKPVGRFSQPEPRSWWP